MKVCRGAENYSVAGRPKRAARKSTRAKATPEPPIQMVVRRGATPRFEALKKKTEHLNVQVVWDRREGEKPDDPVVAENNRRFKDRRGTPPFTWDVADFVVVVPKSKRAKRSK
jgi:hypothetical protein